MFRQAYLKNMMKKAVIILGIILVAILVYFKTRAVVAPETVSYFAKVKTLSTSGSVAFYYYDPETQQADCEREDGWFWGAIRQVDDDQKALAYFQFLSDHEGAVFKVTGVREADDCGYLEGRCLQSIVLDKVEAVEVL